MVNMYLHATWHTAQSFCAVRNATWKHFTCLFECCWSQEKLCSVFAGGAWHAYDQWARLDSARIIASCKALDHCYRYPLVMRFDVTYQCFSQYPREWLLSQFKLQGCNSHDLSCNQPVHRNRSAWCQCPDIGQVMTPAGLCKTIQIAR
jgi:hypothetical protein